MDKNLEKRLNNEVKQTLINQTQSQFTGRQFDTVEELLRYDASHNPAPASIEQRLKNTLANEKAKLSFWRRWFKKS